MERPCWRGIGRQRLPVRVVVTTGAIEWEKMLGQSEAAPDLVLQKPVDFKELLAWLEAQTLSRMRSGFLKQPRCARASSLHSDHPSDLAASDRTLCGVELAVASTLVPACVRIWRGQVRGFLREVGVADRALAGGHVFQRDVQRVHVRVERVLLERAQPPAEHGDLPDRRLDDLAGAASDCPPTSVACRR